MQAELSSPRTARARYRHELRTLTYVTLDQANGGIIRNLSHQGIAVQAVAALRLQQQLRVRFELRSPRLRVEARGDVIWATSSGQCGIRFLDPSPRLSRQIDEWIFGNLLEGASWHAERPGSMFAQASAFPAEEDGMMVSAGPRKAILLPMRPYPSPQAEDRASAAAIAPLSESQLDWLSQPLSGRSLAWTINTLVIVAAVLLFAVVFLGVLGEPPKWPLTMAAGAAALVGGLYWGFFALFGGLSPGTRLARLLGSDYEEEGRSARFR